MSTNPTNENSGLLPVNNKGGVQHGVFDDHGESFVHAKTGEHKMFLGFLLIMIVCLIGLGVAVVYDSTAGDQELRNIQSYDVTANAGLDLLNSLWHENASMESGCESTVLLMRHCEKNSDWAESHGGNSYCSWLGRERSFFLASLFDPNNPQRRWPKPEKIFALTEARGDARFVDDDNVDSKSNYREIETVLPLANMFNLEVDVYGFDAPDLARDYFELLQNGDMCGKVTVISWKHDLIPGLAQALACGPGEGCPYDYPDTTYDEVWQIKYVYDPKGKAKADTTTDPMNLPVQTQGPLMLHTQPPANGTGTEYVDDDDDDDDNVKHRLLKKRTKRSSHANKKHKKNWVVYGTKTQQYFDPLQYSMKVGDYPADGSGSPSGGKWANSDL